MSEDTGSKSDLPTRITRRANDMNERVPSAQNPCFIQYNGDALGRRYPLVAPEILLGRSASADVVIPDDSVSREHAKCFTNGPTVEIEDLGSSNGTFVNRRRIEDRIALSDGDIVQLGSIHLKYFSGNSIENVFHDKIYRKATIDPDTQVFNKQFLLDSLEMEFAYSRSHGRPLSVIYFDLDFFKKVNDVHGHSCGDYILRACAQLAKSCLRNEDILGRYGGEEFVVVLPNCDARLAAALAERLRKAIEFQTFTYEGKTLKQTISIGVSEDRLAFATFKELLDDADGKLYQSKSAGRNRVTV